MRRVPAKRWRLEGGSGLRGISEAKGGSESAGDPMKIYIAASSNDITRAALWHEKAKAANIETTSTWLEIIESVGNANPRDVTAKQRADRAFDDLFGVHRADLFWLLVPSLDKPTRGAWIEFGSAQAKGKRIVCSGDTKQSIFCAVGTEFERDEDAFAYVLTHR
jgi:hypothetical protein